MEIAQIKDQLKIPLKEFVRAPARLKRLGITFLVTLEQDGTEELVPFRLGEIKPIQTRFCQKQDLVSWRGKYIHPISFEPGQTKSDLMKKILQSLKTSVHRFFRRLQKYARSNKLKREKKLARAEKKGEPFRRTELHQIHQN